MKKLIVLLLVIFQTNTSFAQTELLVVAKNGLNVRLRPAVTSEKIGKFKYAEKVKVLEKTTIGFKITDNSKVINGHWYKVQGKEVDGEIIKGYVFSGFLTEQEHKAIFEFISYDDNWNYYDDDNYNKDRKLYLFAKKENTIYRFINYKKERTYKKGDIIEITSEKQFEYTDEGSKVKDMNDVIISITKEKSGKLTNFWHKHPFGIGYHSADKDSYWSYQARYLDKIKLLVPYYLANSKNKFVNKIITDQKESFRCFIKKQVKGGKEYTVIDIRIGYFSYEDFKYLTETKRVLLLFFDANEPGLVYDKLYEYDEVHDKLVKFKE